MRRRTSRRPWRRPPAGTRPSWRHASCATGACSSRNRSGCGRLAGATRISGSRPASRSWMSPPPPDHRGPAPASFRREGVLWALDFGGRTVRLPDSKGLRDLHVLLARPGSPVPAVELVGAAGVPDAARREAPGSRPRDPGEVLGAQARESYRRRIRDLDEDIGDAESLGDDERAARSRVERDRIVEGLSAAYGLAGKP